MEIKKESDEKIPFLVSRQESIDAYGLPSALMSQLERPFEA